MMKRPIVFLAALGLCTAGTALAHHGWGSYDAAKPITVAGPIASSKFEMPHSEITVRAPDKVWTVTLAPTFRMTNRGATSDVIAVGKMVSAYGYPSTVEKDEIRAGIFLTKDGGQVSFVQRAKPTPVRYGDPPPR